MEEIDILIIGAGVIGLSVARELSQEEKSIAVLEKNNSFGQETSSRNSEVIHGGMYYPGDSLKARLCVDGRHLLYDLCRKNNIACRKTGKFIVAVENSEIADLNKLFSQGRINGVEGLEMISSKKLQEMEPNIQSVFALYSPETGIIDSHGLMQYFLGSAQNNGAMIAFDSEVTMIEKTSIGYKVTVRNGKEITEIKARAVINCAGLDSDTVARMAGIDVTKCNYQLHYCKGQYFRVNASKTKMINHLVYPVPKPKSGGLGIHATLDLAGSLRLGPDEKYFNNRIKDYFVDENKRKEFHLSVKKFLPFIEENDLIADTSGIRPKLQAEGEGFRDFIIKDESDNGLPGFINLIGIESPGLTASLAIAKMVKNMIKECLN